MRDKTKKLTRSAVLLALMMIFLYLRSILPVYHFAFYIIAGFIPAIVLLEYGIKYSILFTIAAFLLSFVLPLNKLGMIIFYSFFGIYAIVKYLIERIHTNIVVLILKIAYFSIIFFGNYYIALNIVNALPEIVLRYNLWLTYIISIILFILYDYLFTSFTQFYISKIRR